MLYLRGRFPRVSAAMVISALVAVSLFAAANPYQVRTFVENGREIAEIIVPGRPPVIKAAVVQVPESDVLGVVNVLSGVPAFTWCYGCSATSAAMMMGYYDRNGYSNMYAGQANGGVCPLNNVTFWGNSSLPGGDGECPLSATHMGKDGRATRGNVDDYWIDYGDAGPDPWMGNWAEHTHGDCTADFMGTNQSSVGNTDGSTTFYSYTNGDALYNYTGCEPGERDGCHGMRLFAASRGYTVNSNFSQYIYPNPLDPEIDHGFTFANFKAEIDAGRPVMIQVLGHSMVGYGYDDSSNLVYIHDTWDNNNHSMTWGGSYSGMLHYGVTVLQLAPGLDPPVEPIHLLYPSDSGIALQRGTPCLVQWETVSGDISPKTPLKITLWNSAGMSWVLTTKAKNTGSWLWKSVGAWKSKTQPGYPDGNTYSIVVSTLDDSMSDESDNDFAIGSVTSLQITGPATVTGGDAQQYACTGYMNYGADQDLTGLVKWKGAKTTKVKGAKIGKTGLLATAPLLVDSPYTITATHGKGKPPLAGTLDITITP